MHPILDEDGPWGPHRIQLWLTWLRFGATAVQRAALRGFDATPQPTAGS